MSSTGDQGFSMPFSLLLLAVTTLTAYGTQAQMTSPLLDEILVTARKRPESVQQVGMAIEVVDAQTIRNLNLQNLPAIAPFIANVELFEDYSGASIPTWVIRGVGLQDFNTNNTPTAAIYVDEVYQTATVMGGSGLFDTEQVAVLKGPQGGLYGRNTTGGAVLMQTRRAQFDADSAEVRLDYGRWQTLGAEAAINKRLGESVAWRVAGRMINSDSGWQRSLQDDRVHGRKDLWDLRSWLAWQVNDRLRLDWKLQGGRDDSEIPLGRAVGLYGPFGRLCDAVRNGSRSDADCMAWSGFSKRLFGGSADPIAAQSADGSKVWSDRLNRQRNQYHQNTLIASLALEGMHLTAISSLDGFNYGVDLDLDGTPGEFAHRFSTSDIKVISQEVRLRSDHDGALQWLLGISYSDERFSEARDFRFRDNRLVVNALGFGQGSLRYDQDTRSAAAYGSLAYDLGAGVSVHSSVRYTTEDKVYKNGSLFEPGQTPTFVYQGLRRDYSLNDRLSGRFGLDWQANEDLLLYAAWAHGFKTGGFYGGFPDVPDQINPYREETITSYESGFKKQWQSAGVRLNGAVFQYEYHDVQGYATELNALTGTLIDVLTNQGDARHHGAELELSWQLNDAFGLSGNIGYLDARFLESGATTRNIDGTLISVQGSRPFAPRWNGAVQAHYQALLRTNHVLFFNVNYHHRTALSGFLSSEADRAVNHLPGYGVMNSQIRLSPANGPWRAALWSRNMLDKRYRNRIKSDGLRGFIDLFGEPRSVGLSLDYRL
jgi:iron complex outermembrane recepter protein